jgi:hypothetical protein
MTASSHPASLRLRPTFGANPEPQAESHLPPVDPALLLHADPFRRVSVRFQSAGLSLAGHLYRPPGVAETERTPGVVLLGPFSSVKEQVVPHYAERLANAGYTALTFDPTSFGESEGMPRFHYDASRMVEDYANAVRYLLTREDIDPERVAAVGVCMGGGHALTLAARDKRLKAVVCIGGGYDIGGTMQELMGPAGYAGFCRKINDIVQRQYETGEVQYLPTISRTHVEGAPPAVLPGEEAFSFYDRTSKADAPNWSRQMTAASLESLFTFNALVNAPLVAPTPLLIVHGTRDRSLPPEYAQKAYEAALGPKELVWLETHNHIELYDQGPYVCEAAAHAIRWLDLHLKK